MQIDEIIQEYKTKVEKSNNSINRMEYYKAKRYEQIIKWLEELKEYKKTEKETETETEMNNLYELIKKDFDRFENEAELNENMLYLINFIMNLKDNKIKELRKKKKEI